MKKKTLMFISALALTFALSVTSGNTNQNQEVTSGDFELQQLYNDPTVIGIG